MILHSYLIVPYFSWKFSHAKHHKATGHLTKDMVFIPYTKEEYLENKVEKVADLMEESPIYSFWFWFSNNWVDYNYIWLPMPLDKFIQDILK